MTDARATSRVLTLVFTDLADSTALKTERGDQAVGDLIARHREHVTQLAERREGGDHPNRCLRALSHGGNVLSPAFGE